VHQKPKNTKAATKHLQRTLQINPQSPDADKICAILNEKNS